MKSYHDEQPSFDLTAKQAADQQAADDLKVEQLRAENFEQGGLDV